MSISSTAPAEATIVVRLDVDRVHAHDIAARLADALRCAATDLDARMTVVGAEAPTPRRRALRPVESVPELRILADSRIVLRRGERVELTRLEYDLLLFLCEHPHRVHPRATLMREVWKLAGHPNSRTIDVHVRRLRAKLGRDIPMITTVRGIGYRVDTVDGVSVEPDSIDYGAIGIRDAS